MCHIQCAVVYISFFSSFFFKMLNSLFYVDFSVAPYSLCRVYKRKSLLNYNSSTEKKNERKHLPNRNEERKKWQQNTYNRMMNIQKRHQRYRQKKTDERQTTDTKNIVYNVRVKEKREREKIK